MGGKLLVHGEMFYCFLQFTIRYRRNVYFRFVNYFLTREKLFNCLCLLLEEGN